MFQLRVFAAAAGAVLRLIVAVVVGVGTESRGSSAVASCRHQLVFDVYDGYACDVVVSWSSTDDDGASSAPVVMVSTDGRVPRNATAMRLTLRRAVESSRNGSGTTLSVPLTHLRQLRSLEVDVSETGTFPAGLLSKLGAVSLLRLSLFRSASTDSDYRLRLPTSGDGTFATPNSSLSTLVLSDLGIEALPPKSFDGLTTLCFLFVNNNRLSALPAALFDDLCQLSSLSLAENRFVDVEKLSLAGSGRGKRLRCGLARLRSLDLHGNQLRRLRAGAFRWLRSVVELNLSGNEISVIDAGAFSGLVELRTLYIDANQLTFVESAMFDGLTALTTLDVGRNHLPDVASGAFRNLTSLRTLHLHQNEIQVVDPEAWIGLDQLTELNLESNHLTAVTESMFAGLCRLRQLDLSDNELTVVRADAFVCLPALERLDLSGNLLPDAERHRFEERRWWSNDAGTVPCYKCRNRSSTTTPAEINCGHSMDSGQAGNPCDFRATPPASSSSAVRLDATRVLAVALAVGAVVAALLLLLAAALYLLRRRLTLLDCHQLSTTSTYAPQSSTLCTLDTSTNGIYIKIHT